MAVERPVSHEASRADALLHGTGSSPEEARNASLVLAGHATGADELRLWLEILGLREYQSAAQDAVRQAQQGEGAAAMTFIHPDVPPREITARIRAQIAAQVPDGPALIAAFETIPPWGGRRTADLRAIEAWKRKHHALLKEAKSWPR